MIASFKQLCSDLLETRRLVEDLRMRFLTKKLPSFADLTIALIREQLGSIDHADVDQEMTKEQREAYNAQVAASYESILLPTLKRFAREQEGFTARNAANWEQAIFGRGTINGIELLREHFEKANNEHKAASQQPEPPSQPHNPLPEH